MVNCVKSLFAKIDEKIGFSTLFKDRSYFFLATFHLFGKNSVSTDLLNMLDSELPTIPLASFNNVQGILSSPVAFLSFILLNNLQTVVTLGAFREKTLCVG